MTLIILLTRKEDTSLLIYMLKSSNVMLSKLLCRLKRMYKRTVDCAETYCLVHFNLQAIRPKQNRHLPDI